MQSSYRKLARMAAEPAENNSAPDWDDMDGDDPRRLVSHDISVDQIAVKPAENNSSPGRVDMAGDDPRRLVGHDVPYSSV
jgi:hypothetical protein